jgi:hypothetical protein
LGLRHTASHSLGRFAVVMSAACVCWALLFARVARAGTSLHASGEALAGPIFGLGLPVALFIYARHLTRDPLPDIARSGAALGFSRSGFALGVLTCAATLGALWSLLMSAVALFVVRGSADPALGLDLITTGWIALLAGACYTACFLGLSSWAGVLASVFLLGDWVLAGSPYLWGWPWPRAHLANLLIEAGPLASLSASASAAVLWLLLALGAGLFSVRLAQRGRFG